MLLSLFIQLFLLKFNAMKQNLYTYLTLSIYYSINFSIENYRINIEE